MQKLFNTQRILLKSLNAPFHRYMYDRIDWDARMFGLVGPRGVGKTTMFLQRIKECADPQHTLYVLADNLYFTQHTLLDLAEEFYQMGGKRLFIDEIHKYANWSAELKQIYDTLPTLQVAFTGSSILDINKGSADLTRRAPLYMMQGLSFREYLATRHGLASRAFTLDEIVSGQAEVKDLDHPLPLFADYLQRGYYPFGADKTFSIELQQVVSGTIETDIPQYADMNVGTARKLKTLLGIIARSVPFKPVMQTLSEATGIGRNNMSDYFVYLERAGLISMLRDGTAGLRSIGKTEKVYLDNTNLAYALAQSATDVGNLRETFFYNQMRVNHEVFSSRLVDFTIGGKTFEVGGKNKKQKQLQGVEKGFVVKDNIESAYANVIPLWMFGMNY